MSDNVARHHKRHRRASRKPGDISGRAASQMVPALGCDDSLLNPGQKALALRLRQTQIRKVNKITGSPSHRRRMAGLPFRSPPGAKPTPSLIPSRPNTKPVIPCSERPPECLDGPIRTNVWSCPFEPMTEAIRASPRRIRPLRWESPSTWEARLSSAALSRHSSNEQLA